MLKSDLKEKWGQYCDTDKLVDDVMSLLTKYSHRNTENGVCKMLDKFFENKKDLIDLFKTSSNYIGDMRIVIDVELERGIDGNEVKLFCDGFLDKVDARSIILKKQDEDGKTINDYIKTGIYSLSVKDLLTEDIRNKLENRSKNIDRFSSDGYTKSSVEDLNKLRSSINLFRYITKSTLTSDVANWLEEHKINGRYIEGMKTSRAFNRICTTYKLNKSPDYNRLFAKYSDMVSGLKRKMKFFISLNPLDYLTMSFGNSWASCHTIDRRNLRGMPNSYSGQYCGGTMSYMLDKTSIITYVHDGMPETYEDGKIYRNMFHYSDGALIQGRIYPQGNDGATDLYKIFRNIMQDELGKLLKLTNNMWTKSSKTCGNNTSTNGVHYPDYLYFDNCNMSYPTEMPSAKDVIVKIGNTRICVHCGAEIGNGAASDRLKCRNC